MIHTHKTILSLSTARFTCCCMFILFAGPAGAGHCDKKPDHPHCNGGGGGGGDHPVDLLFRDNLTDNIGSDFAVSGTITYTDGEPGVSARIREDGLLLFNISAPDRGLELDFSDPELTLPPECGGGCKKTFVDINTVDYPPAAAATVRVFDNGTSQHRTDHFLGMTINETLRAEMKIGFGGVRNSTRFRVSFQALGVGAIDDNIAAKSSFLEITRTSQNTWFIEAVDPSTIGAGDQALLFSKFKQKGTVYQDEGTYHMPFGLTVTCQAVCP